MALTPTTGAIGQHVAAVVGAETDDDDTAGIRAGVGADGRIDADDDAAQVRRGSDTMRIEQFVVPVAAGALLDDLALELLTAKRSVAVALHDLAHEAGRQIDGIVDGTRTAHGGGGVVDNFFSGPRDCAAWW